MVFRQGLNVTMLHCYIVTFSQTAHLVRYRRKVIHDGRKLRIRGHEITAHSKFANSSEVV